MDKSPNTYLPVYICIGLILVTLIAFEPVRRNGFISYDDDTYVTENPHVIKGLSPESIIWAFTTTHASNWHPVTWLSHMLDCELFGLKPLWHHLVNLLFHIANTLLLFWVLRKMTGALWLGAFVAAAFAVHPLHVESVAWIAERKDVLSTLFWFLTIAAYIRYAERPGFVKFLLVISVFLLGLMAKPALVTLPFVLLLLDFWPLCRLQKSTAYKLICEKIPLFALTIASCTVTYVVQRITGATRMVEYISLNARINNAFISYVSYIVKMIYPRDLAVLYPHPGINLPLSKPILSAIVLVIMTIAVIYSVKHEKRYILIGWLWYLGTLVPVIGLVQVGRQAMADRYTYIPSVGIFIIAAFGVAELLAKFPYRKVIMSSLALVIVGALIICTRMQVRHWRNNFTLYEHALAVTENNAVMHNNLGNAFRVENKYAEAIRHYRKAVEIKPNFAEAHYNIGLVLGLQGKLDEAITHYTKAVRVKPYLADAHYNLGVSLAKLGEAEKAISHFTEVLRIKPDNTKAMEQIGVALAQQGKLSEAIRYFTEMLRIEPDNAKAHYNLGGVFVQQGKFDEAIKHFTEVLRIKPDNAKAHRTLGFTLARQGKQDEAIVHFKEALRIDPNLTGVPKNLKRNLNHQIGLDRNDVPIKENKP